MFDEGAYEVAKIIYNINENNGIITNGFYKIFFCFIYFLK